MIGTAIPIETNMGQSGAPEVKGLLCLMLYVDEYVELSFEVAESNYIVSSSKSPDPSSLRE
jgi:hypothetical protein